MIHTFKRGNKVKVPFGINSGWKRGIFSHYSKDGKYGFFVHTKSGKLLKRWFDDFDPDSKAAEARRGNERTTDARG